MKKISVGISDFRKLIVENYIYVDKTHPLKNLIDSFKQVFLARPRRFGKTLLLKTLQAIFESDADLFTGLKIAASGYKFEKYPVLYINMALDSFSQDAPRDSLMDKLKRTGKSLDVDIVSLTPGGVLRILSRAFIKNMTKTSSFSLTSMTIPLATI
jgi:hypothetical protein